MYAEWVKMDFRILGVVAIVIVISKLALLFYGQLMPRFSFLALDYISTAFLEFHSD